MTVKAKQTATKTRIKRVRDDDVATMSGTTGSVVGEIVAVVVVVVVVVQRGLLLWQW